VVETPAGIRFSRLSEVRRYEIESLLPPK